MDFIDFFLEIDKQAEKKAQELDYNKFNDVKEFEHVMSVFKICPEEYIDETIENWSRATSQKGLLNKVKERFAPISDKYKDSINASFLKHVEFRRRLDNIEDFFKFRDIPNTPLILSKHEKINDLHTTVTNYLSFVKANVNKETFLPYLERLEKIKTILE